MADPKSPEPDAPAASGKGAGTSETPSLDALEHITAEEILRRIHASGFTEATVALLHLVPLVQVAWADGKVTRRERERVLAAARLHGIRDEDPVFHTLEDWLSHKPTDQFFQRALQAIREIMLHVKPEQRVAAQRDLLSYCTTIARASGGIFGMRRISDTEQEELDLIAAELQRDNEAAAQDVLEKWARIQASPDISVFL